MPVASSSFALGSVQIDGRRYVRETHALTAGSPVVVEYLAAPLADYTAIMNARVALINAMLSDNEVMKIISDRTVNFVLVHATLSDLAAVFWRLVRIAQDGDKLLFEVLCWFLEELLLAGKVTDAQARNSFNNEFTRTLTALQWTTLRTNRIQPAHDRWAVILAETAL